MLLTRPVSILVVALELGLLGLWRFPNPDLFFLRTQWQLWLPRFRSPTTSDSRLLSSMIRPAISYSAQADIHLGFSEEIFIPAAPCNSSATNAPALTVCPTAPIPVVRQFGIDVHASLKLTSTTLDLSQRSTPTSTSASRSGPSSGSGSGTGAGSSQGLGTGPGQGSSSGSNSGSGSGYNPGAGGTTTGAGQPSNNPAQSRPTTQSTSLVPWMYGILGIIAVAIIGSAVWFAGRRMKKPPAQVTYPSV
jgi:hypothetical protein